MITAQQFSDEYTAGYKKTFLWLLSKRVQYDIAEEINSWAWAKAWEKQDQYRGDSAFHTWVNQIAWNRHVNLLRTQLRRGTKFEPLTKYTKVYKEHFDQAIEAKERMALLTVSDQEAIKAQADGLQVHEIAARCHITVAAIKSRLMRAKALAKAA
jgi:DNA-directed RNA polymerase specialized sigma24 family protein